MATWQHSFESAFDSARDYGGNFDARESVFRILLFKLFNKIETWQLLEESHGELTTRNFDIQSSDRTLMAALAGGASIYSAAYKQMPSCARLFRHAAL